LYDIIVYAGSFNGLYLVDASKTINDYLPSILPKIDGLHGPGRRYIAGLAILAVLVVMIYMIRRRKAALRKAVSPPTSDLTLVQVREDIIQQRLLSVEDMAEWYETNPVQLNRIFKTFETTPGKYLRQVKLEHARSLFANSASMEELIAVTGYSADYLRKHLKT
jgi:AraC-like DNA-binding protein